MSDEPIRVPEDVEELAECWAQFLTLLSDYHCTPYFAADLAARGCTVKTLRFAHDEWDRAGFDPPEFKTEIGRLLGAVAMIEEHERKTREKARATSRGPETF